MQGIPGVKGDIGPAGPQGMKGDKGSQVLNGGILNDAVTFDSHRDSPASRETSAREEYQD